MPRGRSGKTPDLKTAEVSEIRRMGRSGKSAQRIADETNRSISTVRVYAGKRYANRPPKYDLIRLLREYEGTQSTQERAELAERLGFPTLAAMRSMVCYGRAHMKAKGIQWRLPDEKPRRMGLKPRFQGGQRGTSGSLGLSQ